MAHFFLVRHGATKMNSPEDMSVDRERGWSDVPLTREGELEAQKAGIKLRGKGIEHVSSSNLNRATETARIIGQHLGVHPASDPGLRPWNLGELTGRRMKEAQPEMEDYARNRPDEKVPKGESFNEYKSRALRAVAKHIRTAGKRRSLLVSHHRVERLLSSLRPDGSTNFDTFFDKGEPPGGIQEFDLDPRKLEQFGARAKNPSAGGGASPSPEDAVGRRGATTPPASIPEHDDGDVPVHHHNLALGGAHHLAKAGYITPEQHRQIKRKVRNAMLMRASLRDA